MKKERQVHMLPTGKHKLYDGIEETADVQKADSMIVSKEMYITSNEEKKVGDWVYNCVSRHKSTNSHVYKIKEQSQVNNANTRKIIATTDPKLRNDIPTLNTMGKRTVYPQLLPQVPQSFVKEYCKQGGIDKVMVEYENCCSGTKNCECEYLEQCHSPVYKPKLIDNTIIISEVEEKMYSESKLIEVVKSAIITARLPNRLTTEEQIDLWIKENL